MGMSIIAEMKIFGLDAKQARLFIQALRRTCNAFDEEVVFRATIERIYMVKFGGFDYRESSSILRKKMSPQARTAVTDIINNMLLEGYLTQKEELTDPARGAAYIISDKGAELSRAKFTSRMSRAKACQRLDQFLARVEEWNAGDPGRLVKNVWLYGSLITDAQDIGDIDLVCEYCANPGSPNQLTEREIMNLVMQGLGINRRAECFIRNRSPYLSMDGFFHDDLSSIRGGYVQIVKDGKRLTSALPKP